MSDQIDDQTSNDFKFPKKFARPETVVTKQTVTSNSFLPLADMDSNTAANKSDMPESTLKPSPPADSAKEKPQPLLLQATSDYKDTPQRIADLSDEKFSKKAIDGLIRITPSSVSHYRTIQNFLTAAKVKILAFLAEGRKI